MVQHVKGKSGLITVNILPVNCCISIALILGFYFRSNGYNLINVSRAIKWTRPSVTRLRSYSDYSIDIIVVQIYSNIKIR